MSVIEAALGRPHGLRSLQRYAIRWPNIAMPEVAIFIGSGCLLYAIHAFGVIDVMVEMFAASLRFQGTWLAAPYQVAFVTICVLFWVGVHPNVSALIIAQAIVLATTEAELSMPTAAFAIVAGSVTGMLASPFSALNNLWATISQQRVTRIIPTNAGLAAGVFVAVLAYLEVLARL